MVKKISENGNKLVTSEFVSFGHPDKIADQIADAILDAYLAVDKNVRTGIEVMVKDNIVVLGGEINSTATINYDTVVRSVFKNLNFPLNHHLTPSEIKIINLIGKQSEEIHSGVDKVDEIGAGTRDSWWVTPQMKQVYICLLDITLLRKSVIMSQIAVNWVLTLNHKLL